MLVSTVSSLTLRRRKFEVETAMDDVKRDAKESVERATAAESMKDLTLDGEGRILESPTLIELYITENMVWWDS